VFSRATDRRSSKSGPTRSLALLLLLTLGTTACFTGKRPTVGAKLDATKPAGRQALGVPAVDAVVVPLEGSEALTYTARYHITPTNGTQITEAIVVQQPGQRSVTIGETRYLHGPTDQTCNLTTKVCEPGLLEQRVSNIAGASSTFDRTSPARRVRLAATATAKAAPYPSTEAFELLETTCVNFPNGKAADTYCVLPNGQLARLERADTMITLQETSTTVDPAAFAKPV
jgi:hypothetical protein